MTRRKSILKILIVALAVLLLAVFFAGCGEYKPPANTGDNPTVTPGPEDPVKPIDPDVPETEYFTATLTDHNGFPFTSADYKLITEQQAQWTEITDGRPKVYRARFDEKGVAKVSGLDGDFNVTLVMTESFKSLYAYNPNPVEDEGKVTGELIATNYNKDVNVRLYKLMPMGKKGEMTFSDNSRRSYITLEETGAYAYELKSRDDRQMFYFVPQVSGEYSFVTMMDVTEDEINPIVDLHCGQAGYYMNAIPELTKDDGGAEGNFTKNVYLKYFLPEDEAGGSNCLAFNLYSKSEKPDAYPLTIYFLLQKDNEFTARPTPENTEVPVTEDFTKTPATPDGTFRFVGEYDPANRVSNTRHILNQKTVKYNDPKNGGDGYYYYLNPATNDFYRETDGSVSAQYRLYVKIKLTNPIMAEPFTGPNVSLYHIAQKYGMPEKNYHNFINGTNGYAAHCNGDGAYPVNEELKQFVQDYAVSQRMFNDGNGWAEWSPPDGPGYNSDEDSQWLFACGVYVR